MKSVHRSTPVRFASFLAPIFLAGFLSAWQVPGPSAPQLLFVPGNRVPLSEYVAKNQFTATMHVEPEILQWICDHSGAVQVAVRKTS